jgi:branched-chain amino acid aminotransferase
MGVYFFLNGRFYPEAKHLLDIRHRAFRYGETVFETLLLHQNKLLLLPWHLERLEKGLAVIGIQLPEELSANRLEEISRELAAKNQIHSSARIRLSVSRGPGGLYDFKENYTDVLIEAGGFDRKPYFWNENGLQTDLFKEFPKDPSPLSFCKNGNHIPYVLAARFAGKNKLNDAILCNSSGELADTSLSNIFLVKNNQCYTPPISSGTVAGVMRRYLLEKGKEAGFDISEKTLLPEDLGNADELFTTNMIKGLRWVGSCGSKTYAANLGRHIFETLIKPLTN